MQIASERAIESHREINGETERHPKRYRQREAASVRRQGETEMNRLMMCLFVRCERALAEDVRGKTLW
jgi:hypothetical protein